MLSISMLKLNSGVCLCRIYLIHPFHATGLSIPPEIHQRTSEPLRILSGGIEGAQLQKMGEESHETFIPLD